MASGFAAHHSVAACREENKQAADSTDLGAQVLDPLGPHEGHCTGRPRPPLRILNLIASHPRGEVCQVEFTHPRGLSQPTVSRYRQAR